MAETITTDTQTQPEHPTAYKEPQRLSVLWQRIALGVILLISVFRTEFSSTMFDDDYFCR
jgi:hypothetical protein